MGIFLRSVFVGVGAVLLALEPAAAQIQAADLAASDVVVDAAATVSSEDRERLSRAAQQLRDRGRPTKFVVVADRPVNPPETADELRRSIGFNGSVLLLSLSPRSLGIGSALPGSVIQGSFRESMSELQADPIGGMIAVAGRLTEPAARPSGSRSRGAPGSGLFLLLPVVGGFFLLRSLRRRSHHQRQPEVDVADEQAGLEPLVDALAAQIGELDTDIRFGGDRAKEARPHYDHAVLAYGEVRDAMPSADTAVALESVRRTLEQGLRSAQAARAVLDGRPPPPPEETALLQGLCTFDPKHGRAVRRMRVVTPAGDEATLPVCRNCSAGLEQGQVPDVRRVSHHGEEVPYWQGAGMFGFAGGLLPMFGGMLGGMVLHDLLTPDMQVIDGGDFDGFGGGDFGGGDFGGDFGGGDF